MDFYLAVTRRLSAWFRSFKEGCARTFAEVFELWSEDTSGKLLVLCVVSLLLVLLALVSSAESHRRTYEQCAREGGVTAVSDGGSRWCIRSPQSLGTLRR